LKKGDMDETSLEELLKMREDQETFKRIMCDELLPPVCGAFRYRANWHKKLVQVMTTPTDEAWTLLVVENSWEQWLWHSYDKMDAKRENRVPQPKKKYTCDSRGEGRNKGWSQEGIKRFNELEELVKADRRKNKKVDEEYLEEKKMEKELDSGKRKRKKASAVSLSPVVAPVVNEDLMETWGAFTDD
jgi:hypothetical protein